MIKAVIALKAVVSRLAVNPALRHTALNQLVRLALGPIVLIALPVFLSPEQLGFWYAMTGVAAILAFADLGVSTAVMQFSAHEHARSTSSDEASEVILLRQDALLVFAMRRIGLICLGGLPLVLGIGVVVMGRNRYAHTVEWVLPWIMFCIASAVALMQSVLLAFCEGRDGVASIQRIRALMAFLTLTFTVGGTAIGLGLWTLSIASTVASVLGFVILTRHHLPDWHRLLNVPAESVLSWKEIISPLLTRYSLNWVAGYLMFQLFAPIAIYLEGPQFAGRVGITVSIFTSLFTLANVWSLFRLPILSMAVARRDKLRLRSVFITGTAASLITYVLFAGSILVAYQFVKGVPEVALRLLDPTSMTLLAIGWGLQVLVQNAAQFLRAFKVDPLVWAAWLCAIHTLGGTVAALYLGYTQWMFAAFVTSFVWILPVAVILCRRRLRSIADWPASHTFSSGI